MAAIADELAPFVLPNVRGLASGDQKGSGAYGAVYEVIVNDVRCIAKRLHDILISPDVSPRERALVQEKFRQECILLSKLRHPNIVHFVGVLCGENPRDLTLIMERLNTDLGIFLESHPAKIPLSIKLSILLDISYGLLYLHSHSPPIVHRDLSANNILLTKDFRAVIADLGVSKLLDLQRQTKTLTKAPGTLYYMPPEALKERPVYDVSLDAFSFGHLSLYVANQDFPNVYEVTMTQLDRQQLQTIQILKRTGAIDLLGEDHCLYPTIVRCLQDLPERRPTTSELNSTLKLLTEKHPKRLEDVMEASRQVKQPDESGSELKGVKDQYDDLMQEYQAFSKDQGFMTAPKKRNEQLISKLRECEEQYENLMKDYQDVSEDRGFKEKSLKVYKKRVDELICDLQQCEAQMGKLSQEKESACMQLESITDDYRAVRLKIQELLKRLEAQSHQLTDMENENADLKQEIIAIRKEREELWNELQATKAECQLYKEDFDHEREDRAKAHSQMDDIRTEFTTELEKTRGELQLCKKQLTEVEAVNKRKEGELRSGLEEALAARQEVQAKTSQVKQYKKQVDSLKAQVTEAENQNTNLIQEMERVRTQLVKAKAKKEDEKKHKKKSTEKVPGSASSPVAPPPPGWESRVAELERMNEELRNENDNLKRDNEVFSEEAKNMQKMIASLKFLVDQQHADRAHVPPHGFPPGTKSDMIPPSALSPIAAAASDQFGIQHEALRKPHPPPSTGYGQDQQRINHAVTGNVISQVCEEHPHQATMQHVPYDPNLVCAYCNRQFRMGEIQKYKHHVGICSGSDGTEV